MFTRTTVVGTALLASRAAAVLMHNGLGAMPEMGWNSWNTFACNINEDIILSTAQTMVDLGLRDTGYNYLVMDDCWSAGRFANHTLRPNPAKFPNGMADVASKVHDHGLKFGMYSDAGKYTCGQYAGSLGMEEIDAHTFAGWGVDLLKYDNCYNEGRSGNANISYDRYEAMSTALNSTGRQIWYAMCNWGQDHPWDWAYLLANSWRATGDIYDSFNRPDPRCPCYDEQGIDCAFPGFHCSVMNIINKVVWFIHRSQLGGWNDLDSLEVGNGGQTDDEYKLHFTMWAVMRSPLVMGNDIRVMDAATYSILTNPALLAISQDNSSTTAQRRWRTYTTGRDRYGQLGELQMFSGGTLANGDYVVVLLNAANEAMMMNATLADIFIDSESSAKQAWDIYDLWGNRMPDSVANSVLEHNSTVNAANLTSYWYNSTEMSYAEGIMANNSLLFGTKVGTVEAMGQMGAMVPSHGVAAYRLRPQGSAIRNYKRDEL